MRYALRKLDKIASAMGEDYLNNHILKSLDSFFTVNDDDNVISSIELDAYQTQSGESYAGVCCYWSTIRCFKAFILGTDERITKTK